MTARDHAASVGVAPAPAPSPWDSGPLADLPKEVAIKDDPVRFWTLNYRGRDQWRAQMHVGSERYVHVLWDKLRASMGPDGRTRRILSERAIHHAKLYAAKIAPRNGAAYIGLSVLYAFAMLVEFLGEEPEHLPDGRPFEWGDLTIAVIRDLEDWVNDRASSSGSPRMTVLRAFYTDRAIEAEPGQTEFDVEVAQWWHGRRYPTLKYAGARANSLDPKTGPLLGDEMDAVVDACRKGLGDVRDRIAIWLCQETAGRGIELALAKNRDFLVDEIPSLSPGTPPTKSYHLRTVSAKQGSGARTTDARRNDRKARGEARHHVWHRLDPDLGALIETAQAGSLPPRWDVSGRRRSPSSPERVLDPAPEAPLLYWLGGNRVESLNRSLKTFVRAADVRTPRLALPAPDADGHVHALLPVTVYRFRHGVLTDMIAQGGTPADVTRKAGHASANTVEHYTRANPAGALAMDAAAGPAVAHLVRRMMRGRVESAGAPSAGFVIPASVPHIQRGRALKVLGHIGKFARGECDKNPVIACFGCDAFLTEETRLPTMRELRADFVTFLLESDCGEFFRVQLRDTITAIDEWIEHLTAAEAAVSDGSPEQPAAPYSRRRGRPRKAS